MCRCLGTADMLGSGAGIDSSDPEKYPLQGLNSKRKYCKSIVQWSESGV